MKDSNRGKGGGWITPIPPFHRWVFVSGLACLTLWLPFGIFAEGHGITAEAFQSASSDLSGPLYILGYWLTLFGIVFELAYICVGGSVKFSIEAQELTDASGRSRFLRGKRKYIRVSDRDKNGKRASVRQSV